MSVQQIPCIEIIQAPMRNEYGMVRDNRDDPISYQDYLSLELLQERVNRFLEKIEDKNPTIQYIPQKSVMLAIVQYLGKPVNSINLVDIERLSPLERAKFNFAKDVRNKKITGYKADSEVIFATNDYTVRIYTGSNLRMGINEYTYFIDNIEGRPLVEGKLDWILPQLETTYPEIHKELMDNNILT